MKVYADTNFFCRIYLEFDQTEKAQQLDVQRLQAGAPPYPVTMIGRMELVNSLQRYVFAARSGARPRISLEAAAAAQAQFLEDLEAEIFICMAAAPNDLLLEQFEVISLRHTARQGFRTYDILHVSCALLLECDTFWSFDQNALRLARLEGLMTN